MMKHEDRTAAETVEFALRALGVLFSATNEELTMTVTECWGLGGLLYGLAEKVEAITDAGAKKAEVGS